LTRFEWAEEKATKRPVAEIETGRFEESPGLAFPGAPAEFTLTRVVFTATPAEAGTEASAKAETVSVRNRCLNCPNCPSPSPPSLWRMQGEHTPAGVAGSRVAGFSRRAGTGSGRRSARSSAMDKAMMASSLAVRSLLSIPQRRRKCRAMAAAAIDCVKAAVPVPADPLTAPHRERWGQELLHYDVSKCHASQESGGFLSILPRLEIAA
jgi:hypothetical protein